MSGSNVKVTSGGQEMPDVSADAYASGILNSATPGPVVVVPAVAGKAFFLARWFAQVDANSLKLAAGVVIVHFEVLDTDGVTVLADVGQAAIYVPGILGSLLTVAVSPSVTSGYGYGYRALKAGTSLQARVENGPLTSGNIRVSVNYAYCNVPS